MLCTMFTGETTSHPTTFDMSTLIEETYVVVARIRAQERRQTFFPAALLRLIKTQFNDSFHQGVGRRQMVRWCEFEKLWQELATGNFLPEKMMMPGALTLPSSTSLVESSSPTLPRATYQL